MNNISTNKIDNKDILIVKMDKSMLCEVSQIASKTLGSSFVNEEILDNDINLCVSTVDENNMIPYESLELGTPCLVGNSFKAFEGSSLQDYLVVKNADDILEIKEKTLNALENRGKILEEYKLWREKNKQDALRNIKEVLE